MDNVVVELEWGKRAPLSRTLPSSRILPPSRSLSLTRLRFSGPGWFRTRIRSAPATVPPPPMESRTASAGYPQTQLLIAGFLRDPVVPEESCNRQTIRPLRRVEMVWSQLQVWEELLQPWRTMRVLLCTLVELVGPLQHPCPCD